MTNMETMRSRYLHRLSQIFPNIASASTEIINLSSILNLPKGTEHFITDIHGEYEAFLHVLKNGSGSVRIKVTELFGKTLSDDEIRELCTLIYYPTEKKPAVRNLTKEEKEYFKLRLYYRRRAALTQRHGGIHAPYTRDRVPNQAGYKRKLSRKATLAHRGKPC